MATFASSSSRTTTRRRTAAEKIDRMEGENVGDSDSETRRDERRQTLDVDEYVYGVIANDHHDSETASDEDEQRRPRHGKQKAEPRKVEWSDDEDAEAVYKAFTQRKTLKRKRAAAVSRQVKAKSKAKSSSMVGRKSHPKMVFDQDKEDQKARRQKRAYGSDSDNDEDLQGLGDEQLPEYVKDRKAQFEKNREKMGENGLMIPPEYEDVEFSDDERLEYLQERPAFPDRKPTREYEDVVLETSAGIIPAPLAQWLRDYQIKGAEFLHEKYVYQKGGILGDDMGLGKTIQVIAFLTAAFGKTGDERDEKRMRKMRRHGREYPRVLIICPGGLMRNWESELKTWGWWHVYVYHGTPDAKEAALRAIQHGSTEIVLTTYSTYRLNKSAINTIDWDCVIADECHTIKSNTSEVTHAMNEINALCRIGLTGTAIQNNYLELWTLLNWTNPGRFGGIVTWKNCISDPLKMGQAHDATYHQLAKARKTANSLVKNLLPQFFLRRMKTLIAHELPKKSDRVVFCPLTDTQADAYENFVTSEIIDHIRRSTEDCDCGSRKKRGWCCYVQIPGRGKWQHYVFPAIVVLQKLTNHVALLIPSNTDPDEKQSRDLSDLQVAMPTQWKDLYNQRNNIMTFATQEFCGKWKILRKLLQFWYANGDKVLVFSHSVRLLQMLKMLFTTTTTYSVSYLDGAMTYDQRAQEVSDFNADPQQFVFLISTRAGGVGLNITSANKVVVFDPNWNPAYDLQAQDRAYRIGQTRDVEVFRLVSAGTIEEIIYARQIYKQQQANIGYNATNERRYFRGVQDKAEKKGEIFGLANLFSYQGDNIVLRDIVNKTNVAESRAGVKVMGIDGVGEDEDESTLLGDDEDALMSQISDLIKEGEVDEMAKNLKLAPKKKDAVQAILSSIGVQYTHENQEVIGTSKIEDRLSKRAAANDNDVDFIQKHVFAPSQDVGREDDKEEFDSGDEMQGTRLKHNPPESVRLRQFCTMAKTFGFDDVTEFALIVEGWPQEQRRECLDQFYKRRRQQLGQGQAKDEEKDDEFEL
ncbi:SNF2 family N-terminal domain-containing protein [Phyllosticta citribraziliensis]|uniref:SNF2 family N-terminal domain-containing protein n=1 Tax=Phyllosticta citribraziliensis TaxID=989973 RepID=A0ABR1LQM9_9PEZI